MKSFICAKNCRLREFTDETYPQAGFCFARLLRDRDIRVNGARTGDNVPLKAGDEVAYYLSCPRTGTFTATARSTSPTSFREFLPRGF